MTVLMAAAGALLLLVVFYDALSTTLVMSRAAGPITARIARGCWQILRRVAPGPSSGLLSALGPLVLLLTVSVWLVLLWGGWTLVFASGPDAVVSSSTGEPAGAWARIYYAAFTTFTLGVGDFVPNGALWQILTSVAVISGLALTTTAITYLVPVVTAVTSRRTQASSIAALGRSAEEIVVAGWRAGSFDYLERQLPRLADEVRLTAQRHLSYPVLHYFHSTERDGDFRIQLLVLDEAVTTLQLAVPEEVRPHPAALASVRHATGQLIGKIATASTDGVPLQRLDLQRLRDAGIPTVSDDVFHDRLRQLESHRQRITAYARESLWYAEAASGSPSGGETSVPPRPS